MKINILIGALAITMTMVGIDIYIKNTTPDNIFNIHWYNDSGFVASEVIRLNIGETTRVSVPINPTQAGQVGPSQATQVTPIRATQFKLSKVGAPTDYDSSTGMKQIIKDNRYVLSVVPIFQPELRAKMPQFVLE